MAATTYAAVASPAIGLALLVSFTVQLSTGQADFNDECKVQLIAGLGLALLFRNPAYISREREIVAMLSSLQRSLGSGTGSGPACIVLGSNKGLAKLADAIGDQHLMDTTNWEDVFRDAVKDPTTRFSFKLDDLGFFGKTEDVVLACIKRQKGATDWELKELQNAGRLGDVYFYSMGKVVPNPFQQPSVGAGAGAASAGTQQ